MPRSHGLARLALRFLAFAGLGDRGLARLSRQAPRAKGFRKIGPGVDSPIDKAC